MKSKWYALCLALFFFACLLLCLCLHFRAQALRSYYEPFLDSSLHKTFSPLSKQRLPDSVCFGQHTHTSTVIVSTLLLPQSSSQPLLCVLAETVRHLSNTDLLLFTSHALDPPFCGWKFCLSQTLATADSSSYVQPLLTYYHTILYLDFTCLLPFRQPLFPLHAATTSGPMYLLTQDMDPFFLNASSFTHPDNHHLLQDVFLFFPDLDPSSLWSCITHPRSIPICLFWHWISSQEQNTNFP